MENYDSSKDYHKKKDYTSKAKEYLNEPDIKRALDKMRSGMNETRCFRSRYEGMKMAAERGFEHNYQANLGDTCKPNIYRSHIVKTAGEVFARSLAYPVFDIMTLNENSPESMTRRSMLESTYECLVNLFKFEDVHRKGREKFPIYGDVYRIPVMASRQTVSGKVRLKPVYKELDQQNMIFDPTGVVVGDDSVSKEIQWWAYTEKYSSSDIRANFGKNIFKYINPGNCVDSENNLLGGTSEDTGVVRDNSEDCYEVVTYQNKSDMVELVLIGAGAFPVIRRGQGKKYKKTKKMTEDLGKACDWRAEYLYADLYGEPILTLTNIFQYYNPHKIRNWGLADKLRRAQAAHEFLQNMVIDSVRKQNASIPVTTGLNPSRAETLMERYMIARKSNLNAVLHLPGGKQGTTVSTQSIEFGAVDPRNAEIASSQMLANARHSTGIAPDQGEVRSNSVGQETILEEEKTLAIESVIESNLPNMKQEIKNLLYFSRAHMGFALNEVEVEYNEFYNDDASLATPGAKPEPRISQRVIHASLPEVLEKLEGFEFDIHIDKNSMLRRYKTLMVDQLSKALAFLPPDFAPGALRKALLHLFQSLGVNDITETDLEDVHLGQEAMGGMSQHQGGGGPGRPEEVITDEALAGANKPAAEQEQVQLPTNFLNNGIS